MRNAATAGGAGNVVRALAWMTGALVSFTVVAIAGREAGRSVGTVDIMFWRNLLGLVVVTAIAAASAGLGALRTGRPGLHLLRNMVHFGGQFSWFHALGLMPLAELFALEFTAPLWVAVLAPLLIGERLTVSRITAALLGFAGLLVIVRPGYLGLGPGSAFALASAIGFALSLIATKRLTRTDGALQILFYMSLLQTIFGGTILAASGFALPPAPTVAWLVAVGIAGLTAHLSMTRAFDYADAIIVAPMDLLRLPLIALVGLGVYAEPLDPWVAVGAAVIIAGNLVNIWFERRAAARRGA
jgi:drug/metabolite transporter (DMT)-like permease